MNRLAFPCLLLIFFLAASTLPARITASLAQKAGADAIDVSAYGNTSKGIAFTEAPLVHEPGGFLKFVRMAKRELTIPVIAVGRIEIDVAA